MFSLLGFQAKRRLSRSRGGKANRSEDESRRIKDPLLVCSMGCGVQARGKDPMYVDGETARKSVGSRSQMLKKEGADIFLPLTSRFGPLGTSEKDCAWAAENLVTRIPLDNLCAKPE